MLLWGLNKINFGEKNGLANVTHYENISSYWIFNNLVNEIRNKNIDFSSLCEMEPICRWAGKPPEGVMLDFEGNKVTLDSV